MRQIRGGYTNGVIEQYEVQSTGIKNFKFTEFIAREQIIVPPARIQQQFQSHFQAIQSEIENPLAREILAGHFVAKQTIVVDFKAGRMSFHATQ